MAWPVIPGERMTLRPPSGKDTSSLLRILGEREVSRWWVGYTEERVRDELIGKGDGLIMEIDGSCAGMLLIYPNTDAEYRHVVIHLFLGEQWHGKRYGAEGLALAINHLAQEGNHRFTLDPNVHNAPAIRSYERLGFTRVGVLREYQLRPEGHWEDGLLMDLVMSEFPGGLDWRRDVTMS